MEKHRSIITSITLFILLLCFTPQSEGRSISSLDRIFGTPLCNKWCADVQRPRITPYNNHLQDEEDSNYNPFYSSSVNLSSYVEISYIHEKRGVLSKWMQYTGSSQRSPPLYDPFDI